MLRASSQRIRPRFQIYRRKLHASDYGSRKTSLCEECSAEEKEVYPDQHRSSQKGRQEACTRWESQEKGRWGKWQVCSDKAGCSLNSTRVCHILPAMCRRFKPGTKALMEIRKLQRGGNLLIPNLPFQRVVREVCAEYTTEPFRFTAEALLALQEASEDMMVCLLVYVLCRRHHPPEHGSVTTPPLRPAHQLPRCSS